MSAEAEAATGVRLELGVAALFLLVLFTNADSLQHLDTANYYLEGFLVTQGYLPYLQFNDNKGPLLYYLLSLPALVSGWKMWTGIIFFRVIDLLIFIALRQLLCRLAFSPMVRAVAMLLFTVGWVGCFPFSDETIYSETPELLFRIIGFSLCLGFRQYLLAGILIGIAALFRQTALIDFAIIGSWLLLRSGPRVRPLFAFACGISVPLGLIALFAGYQGWLGEMIQQALIWNYDFSRAQLDPGESAGIPARIFTRDFAPLFSLAAAGFAILIYHMKRSRLEKQALLPFLIALPLHLLESFSSPLWFAHHVIPSLMSLTVVASCGVRSFADFARKLGMSGTIVRVVGLVIILPLSLIPLERWFLPQPVAPRLTAHRSLAQWIQENSSPADPLLVWGYAPEIYLDAERYPASRFHHNLFLTNQSHLFLPISPDFTRQFREDLAAKTPRFIVLPSGAASIEDLKEFYPELLQNFTLEEIPVGAGSTAVLRRKEGQ